MIFPKFSKVQPNGAAMQWRRGEAGAYGEARCSTTAEAGAGMGMGMLIWKYEPQRNLLGKRFFECEVRNRIGRVARSEDGGAVVHTIVIPDLMRRPHRTDALAEPIPGGDGAKTRKLHACPTIVGGMRGCEWRRAFWGG